MNLTFSFDTTQVEKKFKEISRAASDMRKPFTKAGDDLISYYGKEVFDSNGAELGERWRNLAAATLMMRANRERYYANTPITTNRTLIWTGRLQKGFKKQATSEKLRIFNDVEYFKYHQQGSGRKPPQRRMLGLTSKVVTKVIDRVFEHVDNAVES